MAAGEAIQLLTPQETAGSIGVKRNTLDKWRMRRRGRKSYPLPYVKIGGKVMYKLSDVVGFIESRRVVPGEPQRRSKR